MIETITQSTGSLGSHETSRDVTMITWHPRGSEWVRENVDRGGVRGLVLPSVRDHPWRIAGGRM